MWVHLVCWNFEHFQNTRSWHCDAFQEPNSLNVGKCASINSKLNKSPQNGRCSFKWTNTTDTVVVSKYILNGWGPNRSAIAEQADKCSKAFWHYCFNYNVPLIHSNINTNKRIEHRTAFPSTYICQWIYNGFYWVALSHRFLCVYVIRVVMHMCAAFGVVYMIIPNIECDRKPNAAINFRFTFIHSNSLFETMATDSIRHAFVTNYRSLALAHTIHTHTQTCILFPFCSFFFIIRLTQSFHWILYVFICEFDWEYMRCGRFECLN